MTDKLKKLVDNVKNAKAGRAKMYLRDVENSPNPDHPHCKLYEPSKLSKEFIKYNKQYQRSLRELFKYLELSDTIISYGIAWEHQHGFNFTEMENWSYIND